MQRSLASIASPGPLDLAARECAVIVPTHGAASELRRTLENIHLKQGGAAVCILPDLLTRADFYERLHERLPDAPPVLTAFEREVLFRLSAGIAADSGVPAPFRLRPGLIVEILELYDELRRRHRTIDDFDRLMTDSLAPSIETDRGAERMFRQTQFLSAAFAEFETRVAASGRMDEHGLRALLLSASPDGASAAPVPFYRHVVVTCGDQAADPRGLWVADFDLLARLPGLERVDVIATERQLGAGMHQRIHDLLPGIEEERAGEAGPSPTLLVPEPLPGVETTPWFVSRDREEELADVARWLKRSRPASREPRAGGDDPRSATSDLPTPSSDPRTAVVFQRPLPYLYLARSVFGSAGIPYQAHDALPLAAEPFAAALDLVFTFLLSEGTRASLVELLSSPHWRFADPADGQPIVRADVAAMDEWLRDVKYFGGWDRLRELAAEPGKKAAAVRAASAAEVAMRGLTAATAASGQITTLIDFILTHERLAAETPEKGAWHLSRKGARHLRARGAILGALEGLRTAHARHDDRPVAPPELAAAVRRWIEGQTFAPRTGAGRLTLIDTPAAAYADVDRLRIVGLVESDWPEPGSRSIFYPSSLLSQLGWPADLDRLTAARAHFEDLLFLPSESVSASTFTLEDDAIVAPSALLEELRTAGLPVQRLSQAPPARIFVHEALSQAPLAPDAIAGDAAAWLDLRRSRTPGEVDAFHGAAGPRAPAVYAVSAVERYVDCPFKYFASTVLRLKEERDDESGLTPQERGHFLHEVFETFFRRWGNRGAITTANLADALSLFEEVVEARLTSLSENDRALERTYLLGSAAAPGLAERAFAFEIEHGIGVVERLLEHPLEGTFTITGSNGPREIAIRAKADRIDLLEDGTLRVIDYKLGRAPKPARALQLPIYGISAAQALAGRRGRTWTLSRAGYVAFKEKNCFVSLGGQSGNLDKALAEGQERLLAAVDGIEGGNFPVHPDEPYRCQWCGYSHVCRKDYVGDE
jgi:RecB family exonuclease